MRQIADIIDIAINEHLWDGFSVDREKIDHEFSCPALARACRFNINTKLKIVAFLTPMGIKCRGIAEQFNGIPAGPKRQYARALWLTWAAMIAREEGL